MKKNKILNLLSISCFAIILSLLPVTLVYAGDINSQESEVLEALKGPFEHNGVTYVPAPGYLELAKEYLLADDIDLTVEQKNKAIAAIRTNVETAISNGFIVPLEKEPSKNQEGNTDDNTSQSNNSKPTETLDADDKKEESEKQESDSTEQKETQGSDKKDNNTDVQDVSKDNTDTTEGNKDSQKAEDNNSNQKEEASDKAGALNDEEMNQTGKEEEQNLMIKETGYNVSQALYFIRILLFALVLTSVLLLRNFKIARKNES